MSATILAASAGGLIEQVGSYAGYASIIGLGILALLYFSQAREVRRLREWAGRAPERAAELEQRVQADAQRRVGAAPIAATSAAGQQAVEARTHEATAAVYASIGAPPPGAAPPPGQLARPATSNPPAAGPGAPAPSASPGAPPAAATPAAAAAASRTVPPLANGSTSQETTESAAARPDPLPAPPARPASQLSGDDDSDGFGLSAARIGMIVGGAFAATLVAVVLVLTLAGEDESAQPQNNFGNTPSVEQAPSGSSSSEGGSGSSSPAAALTSAERRATNIAVLNGTTQTGLARAVANKIQEDGFTIGGVATNADQSVPTTIVSYTADNEPAAVAVAKVIGIDRGSVQAADANTAAAADADVIVTVGSDQIE